MLRYVLKRLLALIPIVLGVTFIVFTLLYFSPGDPAVQALGATATEEQRNEWRDAQGLNDPFFKQFFNYCEKVFLHGDLGTSYSSGQSISRELITRFPISAKLALFAIIFDFVFGTPIGILSAIKRYTWQDNLLMVIALIFVSIPQFWLGLELSVIFALRLRLLPPGGLYGAKYYILPVVTLAISGVASAARMTRSCMLDVISQDYITTAKAKGVSEQGITYKHALKNALIPVITQIGGAAAAMIGGAVVIELVFSIPGMGSYISSAIKAQDYPVVLGSVVVLSVFSSLILLVTDLAYAAVDPRIKAQFSGGKTKKTAEKAKPSAE